MVVSFVGTMLAAWQNLQVRLAVIEEHQSAIEQRVGAVEHAIARQARK